MENRGVFPGGWSRYCGQGLERLRWHLKKCHLLLGGVEEGEYERSNRKERVGEGRGGATVERRRAASGRERLEVSQRLSRQSTKSLKERRYS